MLGTRHIVHKLGMERSGAQVPSLLGGQGLVCCRPHNDKVRDLSNADDNELRVATRMAVARILEIGHTLPKAGSLPRLRSEAKAPARERRL